VSRGEGEGLRVDTTTGTIDDVSTLIWAIGRQPSSGLALGKTVSKTDVDHSVFI